MRRIRVSNVGLYFVMTYLLFWILLGATGGVMALKPPTWVVTFMQNVCAWSPTFVVLILFRRLYPDTSFKSFLRAHFLTEVNGFAFVLLLLVQAGITFVGVGLQSLATTGSLGGVRFAAFSTIPSMLLVNATSGPAGEELGWRGFALNRLQRQHTPFASALIVGTVWGFWHAPLWALSGIGGVRLVLYIVSFMVGILSLSLIMTAFYNHHRNILVPMWIHLLFNIILQLFVIDVVVDLAYVSSGYLIFALVLVLVDRRTLFRRPEMKKGENRPLPVTTL